GVAIGCRVLPGGIGSQDLQARAVADLGVTAYAGLPSYLKSIIERYHAAGLDPARWRLGKALVTAEPLPDGLRAELERQVPSVRMAYGTAEAGLLGYEREPGAGLLVPDDVLVQVCDLDSGRPLAEGEGQVVVTLYRPSYPLVRFGTGDLSAWVDGPDGTRRLAGVLGRIGAAVKVRGMFLHPRQLDLAMRDLDAVTAYRFVVDREDHRDELRCQIVPSAHADAGEVAVAVAEKVRSSLRFATAVEIVTTLEDDHALVDLRTWD
ncbi:MAG: phenylacetate--CoA ligase family protein, partial [Thermocrispum sp.]